MDQIEKKFEKARKKGLTNGKRCDIIHQVARERKRQELQKRFKKSEKVLDKSENL